MAIRSITVDQAAELMGKDGGAVYLDVRSRREFVAGHPAGAINIPLLEPDDWGRMAPNPEFLSVAEKVLSKGAKLVVGCLMGKRSLTACQILEQAGYTDLANVLGGYGGAKDLLGRIVQPGWVQLGLPVSEENGEGVSYESLRSRALGD